VKQYTSTRQNVEQITATSAILQGISTDGGLFVPKDFPKMDFTLEEMSSLSYGELAYRVMCLFFDDISKEDLEHCIKHAYNDKFDTAEIAPLKVTNQANFLELFHGPTLAFKDMALSILPYLMLASKRAQNETKETVILTATSGDTGKAALEGFADVEGTRIIVFFPEEGVSDIQKRQMTTQVGKNTLVVGINGNFDDAQTGVKEIFADDALANDLDQKGYAFSSANSINIGRLVPQVVYYFYAYGQLVKKGKLSLGEAMNVVVPTGNFGNILAAYYAKEMGLPIQKFICASNKNKVLYDFFETGKYDRNRDFHVTNSPSMDILISSNLERFLYHMSEQNTEVISQLMQDLKTKGSYEVTPAMKENMKAFYGGYADDALTSETIKKVYEEEGYLMDTHTAVAYAVYETYKKDTKDETPAVIVSTASPYKFTGSVMGALDKKYEQEDDFKLVEKMQTLIGGDIPKGIEGIDQRPINHNKTCEVSEMKDVVKGFLQ
jgi:threonine synthase